MRKRRPHRAGLTRLSSLCPASETAPRILATLEGGASERRNHGRGSFRHDRLGPWGSALNELSGTTRTLPKERHNESKTAGLVTQQSWLPFTRKTLSLVCSLRRVPSRGTLGTWEPPLRGGRGHRRFHGRARECRHLKIWPQVPPVRVLSPGFPPCRSEMRTLCIRPAESGENS